MANLFKQNYQIEAAHRQKLKGHRPLTLWFTGLSGSGKSTIANALEQKLYDEGIHTYTLDGDNIRLGINANLTFSPEDRAENLRRVAEVAKLMNDAGLVVLAAFVSPYRKDREKVKNIVGNDNFVEIYVNTPLETCEARDIKGLYAKARKGEIQNFTGVNAPYEPPLNSDISIDTSKESIETSVATLWEQLKNRIIETPST
ncbi:MAG: adenylyl-sulfate kinase [Bacteroidetes bacterium]|jgi:adenylyl-sulfate kinase|nr:adenylyl-sulfate kinase [Bacteroidota bacterium]